MKKKFSSAWKASKQPRKQRKYRTNAPLHLKYKMLASHLSKELREKYQRRAVVLKKGDTVKVMRGSFRKKQGKILSVKTKKGIVYIENLQKTRKDGTKVNIPFKPSNLLILTLITEDKYRIALLKRTQKTEKTKINKEKIEGGKS